MTQLLVLGRNPPDPWVTVNNHGFLKTKVCLLKLYALVGPSRDRQGAPQEAVWELIRLASLFPAALAVIPFHELLGLGSAARMNVPGRADGQWRWRCAEHDTMNEATFQRLHELTKTPARLAGKDSTTGNSTGELS